MYFFVCFCCLVLKTLKVFLESEYMQFGGGGERCKTFVTIKILISQFVEIKLQWSRMPTTPNLP